MSDAMDRGPQTLAAFGLGNTDGRAMRPAVCVSVNVAVVIAAGGRPAYLLEPA